MTQSEKGILNENGLCLLKSFSEKSTLIKALAFSFFLTEGQDDWLQGEILRRLNGQSSTHSLRGKSKLDYLTDPDIPEFECFTCSMASLALRCQVKLFQVVDSKLQSDSFNDTVPRKIRVFRDGKGNFHAITTFTTRRALIFCQNLALNVVESALDNNQTQSLLRNLNNGSFIHFQSPSSNFFEAFKGMSSKSQLLDDFKTKKETSQANFASQNKYFAVFSSSPKYETNSFDFHETNNCDQSVSKISTQSDSYSPFVSTNIQIDQLNFNLKNQYELMFENEERHCSNFYFPSQRNEGKGCRLLSTLLESSSHPLEERVFVGRIRRFDEDNGYGFLQVEDNDMNGKEVFVHRTQLEEAGLSSGALRAIKHGKVIRVRFQVSNYDSKKYGKCKSKAINVQRIC